MPIIQQPHLSMVVKDQTLYNLIFELLAHDYVCVIVAHQGLFSDVERIVVFAPLAT